MARGRKKAEPKVKKGGGIAKFFTKAETIRSRPKPAVKDENTYEVVVDGEVFHFPKTVHKPEERVRVQK